MSSHTRNQSAGWNGAAYHYRYDDHGRVTAQVGTGSIFPNILYWGDDPPAEWQSLAEYREYAESFD